MAAAKSKSGAKAPAKKKAPARRKADSKTGNGQESRRFWLMYPSRLIQRPVIWELGQKFKVSFNIRQVSVTDEIGIVCLELDGARAEIKKSVAWLEKLGVSVEPVEINVIDG